MLLPNLSRVRCESYVCVAAIAILTWGAGLVNADVVARGNLAATLTITDAREIPTGDPIGREGVSVLPSWSSGGYGGYSDPPENIFGFASLTTNSPDDFDGQLPRPGDVWGGRFRYEGGVRDHGVLFDPQRSVFEMVLANETGGASDYVLDGFLEWDFDIEYDIGSHDRSLVTGQVGYTARAYVWNGDRRERIDSLFGVVDADDPVLRLTRGPVPFSAYIGSRDSTGVSVSRIQIEIITGTVIMLVPAPGVLSFVLLGLAGIASRRTRSPICCHAPYEKLEGEPRTQDAGRASGS